MKDVDPPLRLQRLNLKTLILIAAAASFLGLAIGVGVATARVAKPQEDPATHVIRSWNEAVATLEIEDQKFRELRDSYKRNPPGRILLVEDVRTEQKKRRLALIAEIIASHEERIRAMKRLARAEEACQ